jgi:hypothetical protein
MTAQIVMLIRLCRQTRTGIVPALRTDAQGCGRAGDALTNATRCGVQLNSALDPGGAAQLRGMRAACMSSVYVLSWCARGTRLLNR